MEAPPKKPQSDRTSPLAVQIVLLIAFLLVVVAGVFTVLVPDLTDEPDPDLTGRADAGPR
jgi:hypothetical protein